MPDPGQQHSGACLFRHPVKRRVARWATHRFASLFLDTGHSMAGMTGNQVERDEIG